MAAVTDVYAKAPRRIVVLCDCTPPRGADPAAEVPVVRAITDDFQQAVEMRGQARIGQHLLDQPVAVGAAAVPIQRQFEQVAVQPPFQLARDLRFPEQVATRQPVCRPALASEAQPGRARTAQRRRRAGHDVPGRAHEIQADGVAMQLQRPAQAKILVDESRYPRAPPGDVAAHGVAEDRLDGLPVQRRQRDLRAGRVLRGRRCGQWGRFAHPRSCGEAAGRVKGCSAGKCAPCGRARRIARQTNQALIMVML